MTVPCFLRLVAAVFLAGPMGACSQAEPAPWLINETESVPRGLYRLTSQAAGSGDLVAVRPPPLARDYLAALGAATDLRLFKRVTADAGDIVCRHGRRLSWPGGLVVARTTDPSGRILPHWSGCRRLGPDERLVIGDSALSFDSRYFGPVRTGDFEGVYEEVWRW
jgi:type IV secretory pathway protease TraF